VAYFLGIDGGGTKTECVLGDNERTLGRSIESTIKIKKVGVEAAELTLSAAIDAVCKDAGIQPADIVQTCAGISGESIPEVRDWTLNALRRRVSGEVTVLADTVIAHHAAFHGGPGVLVIAGTGSNVLGINEGGEFGRAGGWGPMISDEGSGFWIGRLAVTRAMRAYDVAGMTKLLEGIMHAWGLSNIEDVVTMANSNPPPDFSSLLPAIFHCADSGDRIAQQIINSAATELANLVRVVIGKLWAPSAPVSIAVTGGVFANSPHIGEIFAKMLRAEHPAVSVNLQPVHPVMGALAMARTKFTMQSATQ
jgi:glucosamine kinase